MKTKPIKCYNGHIPESYMFADYCQHCQNLIKGLVEVKNGRGGQLTPLKPGRKRKPVPPKSERKIKPVPPKTKRLMGRKHQLRTLLQLNGVHVDDLEKVENYCNALIAARELMR